MRHMEGLLGDSSSSVSPWWWLQEVQYAHRIPLNPSSALCGVPCVLFYLKQIFFFNLSMLFTKMEVAKQIFFFLI